MMFRMRDFFIFLAIALLIMVQTNIQVESTPVIQPVCSPCPPCRGVAVKRYSCYMACPACAY
ncbi:hypothetical protein C2G38_2099088 [Gigaspora rosea]|uniref:Membrane anchor Opy2 N-terminal domain-containing protein n=1 Tax=Gigaspora rosea TaxID=44941 RepID=A0A397USC7_9GLOM|nr:hypothetical protein C2G38_2099088 [Gigaspora rosea]